MFVVVIQQAHYEDALAALPQGVGEVDKSKVAIPFELLNLNDLLTRSIVHRVKGYKYLNPFRFFFIDSIKTSDLVAFLMAFPHITFAKFGPFEDERAYLRWIGEMGKVLGKAKVTNEEDGGFLIRDAVERWRC